MQFLSTLFCSVGAAPRTWHGWAAGKQRQPPAVNVPECTL